MTEPAPVRCRTILVSSATSLAFALLLTAQAPAQQNAPSSQPINLSGIVTYHDAYSDACDKANPPSGPYAGMNPLTCHAESAPTDSAGQCSLKGMTLVQKVGTTCYYCSPITPPPVDGIIIPIDDTQQASIQGYTCGVDEFDQNCMVVCTREFGSGPYIPAPGAVIGSTPVPQQATVPGSIGNSGPLQLIAANPCSPNIDMSSPAAQAAAAQAIALNAAACNAQRCQHNPELDICKTTTTQTPPAPQPNTASTGGLPLPLATRQAVLQAAAQMDQTADDTTPYALAATNHFFKCLAEVLSADLKFFAQTGYVPAAKIAQSLHQGVWTYITSNAYTNDVQLYQGAQQVLNSFVQDPACAVANTVPFLLIPFPSESSVGIPATAAAEGTAVKVAASGAVEIAAGGAAAGTGAAAEAAAAQNAAKTLLQTAANNAEQEAAWGAGPAKSSINPINKFNPECAPNMCFPSAVAQDITLQTGNSVVARTFAENVTVKMVGFTPTNVFNLTTNKTVQAMLQSLYGSKPLQGAALAADRLLNQANGVPSGMTAGAISRELTAAGPNARGLVFLDYAATPGQPKPVGHVVNAFTNTSGVAQVIDASNSGMDATSMVNAASKITFYRTQ